MGLNSNLKVPFYIFSKGESSYSLFDFVWGSEKRPNSTMLPYLILKSYLRFSNSSSSSQYCVHPYCSNIWLLIGIFDLMDLHLSLSEALNVHNFNEFDEKETFHSPMVWWSRGETWNLFVVLTCDPSTSSNSLQIKMRECMSVRRALILQTKNIPTE